MTLARAACYLGGMSKSAREREWAAEERPRERLYHKGAAALSDAELLAIQLGTGVPGLSVLEVARELLTQFGSLQELAGQAHVLAARGGIAARMVVQQDDGSRGLQDGRLEDLAGMDEAGR